MSIEIDLFDWRTLATALLLLGFLPGVVLRQVVRIFPKGDARRAELLAELYTVPWVERPLFVAQQFETALTEGVPARMRHLVATRMRRRIERFLLVRRMLSSPEKPDRVPKLVLLGEPGSGKTAAVRHLFVERRYLAAWRGDDLRIDVEDEVPQWLRDELEPGDE